MNSSFRFNFILSLSYLILFSNLFHYLLGQPKGYNYDESKVPDYKLPLLLVSDLGKKIATKEEWKSIRRPEILNHLEDEIYGKNEIPLKEIIVQASLVESGDSEYGKRKQYEILFKRKEKEVILNVLVFLPKNIKKPVPVFLGLNFKGNHTTSSDNKVIITKQWVRSGKGIVKNRASEEDRGSASSRWDVRQILSNGYGLITAYYGEIDPDFDDGFKNGVHKFLNSNWKQKPNSGGSIDTWAWGLSRIVDFISSNEQFDHSRIIVIGHSRLGKAALWAGAKDERISMVISNNSGCGGAAISRRQFGETVKRINTSFPHWFCPNYKKYNDQEDTCLVDQHSLLSMIAPRPLYVASATKDLWADPKGEFDSLQVTEPVFRLYGFKLNSTWRDKFESKPKESKLKLDRMGYHIRDGKHDVTSYDWKRYLDFANYNFSNDR